MYVKAVCSIYNHTFLLQHKLAYHSSAILAAAIDTFTLRYRLKASSYTLNDLCSDLSPYGRKIAAASLCLPFSLNEGTYLLDCLDNWEGPLSQCITPRCSIGKNHTSFLNVAQSFSCVTVLPNIQ